MDNEITVHLTYDELLSVREMLRRVNQAILIATDATADRFAERPSFTAFTKLDDAAKIEMLMRALVPDLRPPQTEP